MDNNVCLVPGKAPFHFGLFFGAVKYLIGEPDKKCNIGGDGFYDYYWEVGSNTERDKKIEQSFQGICSMMKSFDLKFPESRCDVAKWVTSPNPEKEYFRITIYHQ